MEDEYLEVYFDQYCPSCKHENKSEYDSPCFECMSEAMNLHSHKPVRWEEK